MTEFELTVRRSALLMWFLAVLGVPFVIFGVDILFERRIATSLTDLIYPSTAVTAPAFETHDLAWAWTFLVVGGAMTTWALKELIAPRRIVHADARGVALAVGGPFSSPTRVPWSHLRDVGAGTARDDDGTYPVLRLVLDDRGELPPQPWGARWSSDLVLSVAAGEWDIDPRDVAERLQELATMHRQPAEPPAVRGAVGATLEEPMVDGPWVRPDPDDTTENEAVEVHATADEETIDEEIVHEEDGGAGDADPDDVEETDEQLELAFAEDDHEEGEA